jgi:glyoxylase-like metal-dependent hydrolase (beta-lactamase superfamily II)
MKVAPGIHRIGDQSIVNAYLLEDAGEVTIIDAGVPGYYRDIPQELAAMGRTVADVRALLLTHGHTDHIGFAERLRREQHIPVSVHAADAALARGEVPNPAKGYGPIKLGPLLGFLWFTLRRGGLRVPKLQEVATFGDGATLDVPGSPRIILTPATHRAAPCSTSPPAMCCSSAMPWRPTRSQLVPGARRWRPSPPMPPRRWRP